MIESVPLIQNANDAQQINASIIAMKKASKELDEKILKLNNLNKELDKKLAVLDSGLVQEITDRENADNAEVTNRNTAITNAVNSLDVASVGGSGKYISAISETDGKINATVENLTSVIESGNNQPATSDAVFNYVNRLDIKVPRPSLQYSKVTVALNVSEPYITTLVALMTRGCGLCLIGLCGQDTGTKPNIIKYLFNNGVYGSSFYYRDIGDFNKIELFIFN